MTNYQKITDEADEAAKKAAGKGDQAGLASAVNPDCVLLSKGQLSKLGEYGHLIRDKVCSCKLWGNCVKEVCDCSKMCPDNLNIFKRPYSTGDSLDCNRDSLGFRNGEIKGDDVTYDVGGGYCWGHADLTAKFNRLGFFGTKGDGSSKDGFSPLPYEKGSKKWIREYKKRINAVANNEVAEFPDFQNLNELSNFPGLQSHIKNKVSKLWAGHAVGFQGVGSLFATGKNELKKLEMQKLLAKIEKKISYGMQPQLLFSGVGSFGSGHVVLAQSVKYIESGAKAVICIRDNNFANYTNENCANKMIFDMNKQKITYDRGARPDLGPQDVSMLEVTHNEDTSSIEQLNELRNYCQTKRGCGENLPIEP